MRLGRFRLQPGDGLSEEGSGAQRTPEVIMGGKPGVDGRLADGVLDGQRKSSRVLASYCSALDDERPGGDTLLKSRRLDRFVSTSGTSGMQ